MTDARMATVLVKLENYNPAGSVKDRMAWNMVRRAEEAGLLGPGATLVESTSGNTGLGLAMTAAVRGYGCICTMPDKMSKEKIDMLKAYGAEVIITRTDLPHDHPESYVEVAKRIATETPGGFYVDQYFNRHNPEAHYLTTGPEIWRQTDGQLDALVGGIGTGGTISGAAKYLKEKAAEAGRSLFVSCPDPIGSIYHDAFHQREIRPPGIYRVEGIGHDFLVGTLDFSVIDEVTEVSDKDSFLAARQLARREGIFAGGSAGTAIHGALDVARRLGPGKVVVVIVPDSGDRYLSKCYDNEWMRDMGFLGPEQRLGTVRELLEFKPGSVEFASADETHRVGRPAHGGPRHLADADSRERCARADDAHPRGRPAPQHGGGRVHSGLGCHAGGQADARSRAAGRLADQGAGRLRRRERGDGGRGRGRHRRHLQDRHGGVPRRAQLKRRRPRKPPKAAPGASRPPAPCAPHPTPP